MQLNAKHITLRKYITIEIRSALGKKKGGLVWGFFQFKKMVFWYKARIIFVVLKVKKCLLKTKQLT